MLIQPTRRGLVTGLAALIAAPAVVRYASIMPVKAIVAPTICRIHYGVEKAQYLISGYDQYGRPVTEVVLNIQFHKNKG